MPVSAGEYQVLRKIYRRVNWSAGERFEQTPASHRVCMECVLIQHKFTAFRPACAVGRDGGPCGLQSDLAESRRQFESVLDCLSGIFYKCELEAPWRMSFVSDRVQALTGYAGTELELQNGWSNIMLAEDRHSVESAVAKAVSERRTFDVAYRIICKTGGVRWVSERGHAIYDSHGKALFLEGVITDVSSRKEAEEAQESLLAHSRRALDAIPQMVWTLAGDGSDPFYNAQWANFTGFRMGGTEDPSRAELIHTDDQSRVMAIWKKKFAKGEPYEAQYRLRHVKGGYRWILSRGAPEKDSSGQTIHWYGTCTDIHDEVLAREALRVSEAVSRSMIEASPDCISLLDIEGNTQFLNRAAIQALGLNDSTSLLARPWAVAFPPSFRGPALMAIRQALAGRTGHFMATQPRPAGERSWDVLVAPISGGEASSPSGLICIARDITQQKTAEDRIRWVAHHDPLTRMANRTLFQQTLDRALVAARTTETAVTVLMIDLDDFKRTNDAMGHDAGDVLLTEFADRLRSAVRPDDMVARLGGDEFAVLMRGVAKKEEVEAVVNSILASLKGPCEFEGKLMDIRVSIGASIFPNHGDTRKDLLKHADIALYVAKRSGRGTLRLFQPDMRADAQARLTMLGSARLALREDRIAAHYQPKVDLRTGRLDGFEALLRWEHPANGLQNPDTIAAAFQDGVLASEISERMIASVVSDMRAWTDAGLSFGHVALNAGAAEFKSGTFADKLLEALRGANLPTSCLQLEVTETVFLGRGAEHVEDTLRTLSVEGIQIALDDFGTGYASLSHLNKFPVNVIKIDRSFISKLETSEHDAAIVRAVISLGRSLSIRIVAEGIETARQAEFLKKHRCHSGQGYLFGKAVSAAQMPSLVRAWDQTLLAA